MKKKLLLITFLGFSLFLAGCSKEDTYNYGVKRVVLEEVEKINMSREFSFPATIEAKKETSLATKIPGRVEQINFDIGDEVDKGEVLAFLGGEENYNQQSTAYSAYKNSLAVMEATKLQMEQGVGDARAGLEVAKRNLELAKKGMSNNKSVSEEKSDEAELQLKLAVSSKESLLSSFAQKEKEIKDATESTVTGAVILSNNILSYLYKLNSQNLPDEDNNFEIGSNFVSKSSQKVNEAENIIKTKFKPLVFELEDFYNKNIKEKNVDERTLSSGTHLAKKTLDESKNALQAMKDVIFSSVGYVNMSERELGQYANEIMNLGSEAESLLLNQGADGLSGFLGLERSLISLRAEKESQIDLAEKKINLAKQQIKLLSQSNTAVNDDYSARVAIAEAQVAQARQVLKTAESRLQTQLEISKSQVEAGKNSLDGALIGVGNTKVSAPYKGVVIERYLDEGAVVNPGSAIFKFADISSYKLIIFVPNKFIEYFSVGDVAEAMSMDNDKYKYDAVITRISPQSELGSGKVKVELDLPRIDDVLKIGMDMEVKIKTDSREKTVAIPLKSVNDFYGEKIVFVYESGQVERRKIIVGEIKDDFIEITEGLKTGELVVVAGVDNLRDGEAVETIEKDLVKNKK